METTLVIIKPDGVAKNIIGKILARIESAGLKISAAKMFSLNITQAQELYQEHTERSFYQPLINFITSGAVMVTIIEGPDAIRTMRQLIGATIPKEAHKGSIRYDYADHEPKNNLHENIIHSSDSTASAKKEIALFFNPDEIFQRS